MPPAPAWLAVKRAGDEALAMGARQLKLPKGKQKGKWGKGVSAPQGDEHPGAADRGGGKGAENGDSGDTHGWQEGWDWSATGGWSAEGASSQPSGGDGGRRAQPDAGGGRRPQGRAPPRGSQHSLADCTVSLSKLSLRNSADIRKLKHMVEDFWQAPLAMRAVKAGMERGRHYGTEVRARGKGHGMGPPHIHVALYFLKELVQSAADTHEQEGIEEDSAWAEVTIKKWLELAYQPKYGQTLALETILDFNISEAHKGRKDEGLQMDDSDAPQAKVTMSINPTPQMQVALAPHKQDISADQMKEFGVFQTGHLRMAIGVLMLKFGAKKSTSSGPKTQLERVVETNLRHLARTTA